MIIPNAEWWSRREEGTVLQMARLCGWEKAARFQMDMGVIANTLGVPYDEGRSSMAVRLIEDP